MEMDVGKARPETPLKSSRNETRKNRSSRYRTLRYLDPLYGLVINGASTLLDELHGMPYLNAANRVQRLCAQHHLVTLNTQVKYFGAFDREFDKPFYSIMHDITCNLLGASSIKRRVR